MCVFAQMYLRERRRPHSNAVYFVLVNMTAFAQIAGSPWPQLEMVVRIWYVTICICLHTHIPLVIRVMLNLMSVYCLRLSVRLYSFVYILIASLIFTIIASFPIQAFVVIDIVEQVLESHIYTRAFMYLSVSFRIFIVMCKRVHISLYIRIYSVAPYSSVSKKSNIFVYISVYMPVIRI